MKENSIEDDCQHCDGETICKEYDCCGHTDWSNSDTICRVCGGYGGEYLDKQTGLPADESVIERYRERIR